MKINKIIFKKIIFNNLDYKNFNKYILKKGLFVFSRRSCLSKYRKKSKKYYQSLRYADLVFFDSGFFVLLLRFLKI